MSWPLAVDWSVVRDLVCLLFTGLGAYFFRRTEAARKVSNAAVDRLNGHVDSVAKVEDDLSAMTHSVVKMRRYMAEQARRIQGLESSWENAATENRQLQGRIERLESRRT